MTVYHYQTDEGEQLIPVADGAYLTPIMDEGRSIGSVSIAFYDVDGETIVTPSGGTVTVEGASTPAQWMLPWSGGVISATEIGTDYTPPEFNGICVQSRITLSGITGASYMRARHWRDE